VPLIVVQSVAMQMSVCLSAHVSETTCPNFMKYSVHVTSDCGSILL